MRTEHDSFSRHTLELRNVNDDLDVHGDVAYGLRSAFYAARVVHHNEVAVSRWKGKREAEVFDV